MKLVYYLYKEFTVEAVEEFAQFLNNCSSLEPSTPLDIYIHSQGGDLACIESIRSMVERSELDITLIAVNVFSAAFHLLYMCNSKKKVLPNSVALLHRASVAFEDRDLKTSRKTFFSDLKERLDSINENALEMLRNYKILTPLEIRRFESGEDIILDSARLHKIMKKCPYGTYT